MSVISLDTHRAAKIGGSEAASACGVDPFRSRLMLWAEKTGRVEREETEAMRWGKLLEPVVFQELERREWEVMPAPADGFALASDPRIIGHPDGFVSFVGERAVLEVKTAGQWVAGEWKEDGAIPLAYQVQIQHYMALTGCGAAMVACLIAGQRLAISFMYRDDEAIARILEREANLLDLVRADTPPEPSGTDSDHDAIKALHPSANSETIRLDKPTMQLVSEARGLHEQREIIDRQYKERVQAIQLAMGDAEHAMSPYDTPAASWPTVNATRLDTKALKAARPDVWGEFAVTKANRRFDLK